MKRTHNDEDLLAICAGIRRFSLVSPFPAKIDARLYPYLPPNEPTHIEVEMRTFAVAPNGIVCSFMAQDRFLIRAMTTATNQRRAVLGVIEDGVSRLIRDGLRKGGKL